ncbi:MAG: hypothetical protein KKF62_01650 [Bacteroidetes bacterium]|nr:hypothetical protein [Bacteroidota bacterium]MBU1114358.1 hypothetical protein [Bacteroidota bacterium]MBU1797345.1 hypothetical protein [Bacteroidota bacterium]
MENIYLDFNNHSKSKSRIIFGVLFILLGITNLYLLLNKEEIGTLEIMNLVLFPLVGLFHIFDGLGSKMKDKLGKRFIRINEKEITFKYDFFGKAFELEWGNIKSICIKYASLEFTTKNNTREKISIARLDYKQIREIKEYIKSISKNMNIEEKEIVT